VVPENIHTPLTEGIFHMTPPSPLDFPKTAHKLYPSPVPEIPIFFLHPLEIFLFLVESEKLAKL